MIRFLDLQKVTACHAEEYHEAMRQVVDSGWFLQGEQTRAFESAYASFIGTRHCIGVGNGLDALTLIYRAYIEMGWMQPGDEVLVPANTFIASILAITENGLRPVLVEPNKDTLEIDEELLEQHVTSRTRSLMLVHLYGRCAWTERIAAFCRDHNLLLVEDNAQAHGCKVTKYQSDKVTGALGHAAGHSFYPGKNLGSMGDCGAVTTDDDELAAVIRALGNYGSSEKYVSDYKGRNSRIDELQAAVLDVKLKHLDTDNAHRMEIAAKYLNQVKNPFIRLPKTDRDHVWHIFPVFCEQRDALQQYLKAHGVEAQIHYPIPPHKQQCFKAWHQLSFPITEQIHSQERSIPCHQALTKKEVDMVIDLLNGFTPA